MSVMLLIVAILYVRHLNNLLLASMKASATWNNMFTHKSSNCWTSVLTTHLFQEFEENHSKSALMAFSEYMSLPVERGLPAYGAVICSHCRLYTTILYGRTDKS